MTRRTAPAFHLDSLEPRRLLAGYAIESDDFDDIDLVPGGAGVQELLNGTDDGFGTIDLDRNGSEPGTFAFQFYGVVYTEVRVSANGLITFVNGSSDANNTDLTTSPPQRTIAVLWDDWDTSVGGSGATDSSVLYRFDGDELIIEWNNVTHLNVGGDNGVTFHAVLDLRTNTTPSSSDSKVELHSKELSVGNPAHDEGRSATVGIKDVGAQGPNRLLVAHNGGGPVPSWVGSDKAMEIDDASETAFLLLSSRYGFLTSPHTLTMVFTHANVGGVNPDGSDLVVTPVAGGPSFSPVAAAVSGLEVTFTFAGVVPDGRYDATIAAGAINTGSGAPTTSPVSAPFFFLRGDANRDAAVNLQDFNVLAGNFGASPRDFSQGDFNYDGTVNLSDFNILASRFGTVLPPAAAASTTDVVNTVRSGAAGTRSPFGDSRVADEDDDRGEDELLA